MRLKPSGHANTLTEASNPLDELLKRSEMQNEQQNQNALDKFKTLVNFLFKIRASK